MNNIPIVGQSIRNAQSYLRKISYEYDEIPPVIPDGIFGVQTENAVKAFQEKFGIIKTGEIDMNTWEKLLVVYKEVTEKTDRPREIRIFFSPYITIYPGEKNKYLYPVQSIMMLLAGYFSNLGEIKITGINDNATVVMIRKLQSIFGMEQTGIINKQFWNKLSKLYESYISVDRDETEKKYKTFD